MTEPTRPSRPGSQASSFERPVLTATLDLVAAGGVSAATPEAVARQAGVAVDQVTGRWS